MWTEHPDASMARRRIEPNVGKVEIQSDEDSVLFAASIEYFAVRAATKLLFDYGISFLACFEKQCQRVTREVFVKLEACGHPLRLGRDGYDTFPCKVCGVRNGRRNVFRLE